MPRYTTSQRRKQEQHGWRELPPGSRVVIYGRHSPGESQSIDSQADAMRRWIEERGWLLTREFYDEGIEGSRDDRPAFQEMFAYLRQTPRPVDGVVVWNTARFGRNVNDSQYYKADLRRRGYVVLGKEDGIEPGPHAIIHESLLEWQAQHYLEVLSADTRRGLYYMARNGFWPGGRLPIGFEGDKQLISHRKNGDPHYGICVRKDVDVAERVEKAWKLRLGGASLREIHDETQLFPSHASYSTFFRNALYAGILEYGGKRYPEHWQQGERFCEPYVEPYVTEEEFERVREHSRAWAERTGIGPDRHPRNRSSNYLLSGLAICGYCLQRGETVSLAGWTDSRRRTFSSYRCGRKQRVRGSACQLRSVPCWLLEQTVIQRVQEALTPEYILAEVEQANAILLGKAGQYKARIRKAEAAEAKAQRTIERLGRFISEHDPNPIIEEQYRAADRDWRRATAELKEAKEAKERAREAHPLQITHEEASAYVAHLAEHLVHSELESRRRFLAAIVRRIILYDAVGDIELAKAPALRAIEALSTDDARGGRGDA